MVASLSASSAEDVPRGMEFLYSRNRLNVAVSRAKALCIMVGSPSLLAVRCRTAEQMRLAKVLCRYVELAGNTPRPAGRPGGHRRGLHMAGSARLDAAQAKSLI